MVAPQSAAQAPIARRLWPTFETYHASVYFAPEAAEAYKALGLKGGWMAYFASRGAALGAAPPGLVTAVFFNFHPAMVTRALPAAWALASPEDILAARQSAADAILRRLLGDEAGSPAVAEAAALAREALEPTPEPGRPLYGALRNLPWPEAPHLALWHATTLLREHRGDGHVAALSAAGLDGCEAHVTHAATGAVARKMVQENRWWSDEEWAAAAARLVQRGWLDADGTLTDAGREGRRAVEDTTDALAAVPWHHLGPERSERLLELLAPLARTIVAAGGVPVPSPVGAPPP